MPETLAGYEIVTCMYITFGQVKFKICVIRNASFSQLLFLLSVVASLSYSAMNHDVSGDAVEIDESIALNCSNGLHQCKKTLFYTECLH